MATERRSPSSSLSSSLLPSNPRHRILEFLFHSSEKLNLQPVVKYTALAFFADRFFPSLQRKGLWNHWLLSPLRESNLQLLALAAIWVSSKIHNSRPLSVKSLKSLGDAIISDQHFTTRDFVDAELLFLEVLRFEIGASCITFVYLEDFVIHFSTSYYHTLVLLVFFGKRQREKKEGAPCEMQLHQNSEGSYPRLGNL